MASLILKLMNPFLVMMILLGVILFGIKPEVENRRQLVRWARRLYGLLYVYTTPAFAYVVCGSLEWQCPEWKPVVTGPSTIVVLGGGVVSTPKSDRSSRLASGSLWRCHRAAELYRLHPESTVFVIGGNPDGVPGEDVSKLMGIALEELGVRAKDMVVETESRNTFENAAATNVILQQRGISSDSSHPLFLVTSRYHMPRAVRLFQRTGMFVVPVGCDSRVEEIDWNITAGLPSSRATDASNEAMREWLSTAISFLRYR